MSAASDSERLVHHLTGTGETIACAESLTAGLLAAAIADTPGASLVLRGGVVAYAAEVKVALLGVDPGLIERAGTVDPRVAVAMAEGARSRLGATWGVSTTGVAGPGPAEGKPAGTVHVAVSGPAGTVTRPLRLHGGRAAVRQATVAAALALAVEQLGIAPAEAGPVGVAPAREQPAGQHPGVLAQTAATPSDPRGTVGGTGPTTDGTTRRTT
jgi:nicotinamide-nucleotide amidase